MSVRSSDAHDGGWPGFVTDFSARVDYDGREMFEEEVDVRAAYGGSTQRLREVKQRVNIHTNQIINLLYVASLLMCWLNCCIRIFKHLEKLLHVVDVFSRSGIQQATTKLFIR